MAENMTPAPSTNDPKPAFYTAFGSNGAALPQYAAYSEQAVVAEVLAVARNQGFNGTGEERMRDLGWSVKPVFSHEAIESLERELRSWQVTVENRDAEILQLKAELEAVGAGRVQPLRATPAAAPAVGDEMEVKIRYDVLHEFAASQRINYNDLCRAARAALADSHIPHVAVSAQKAIHALVEARSVISSINRGASQRITVGGDTCYWQREEWVDWAVKEVLPLIDAALAATPALPATEDSSAGDLAVVQAEPVALAYPHEQMDALAISRYKVVPSDQSMYWRHAVVAGDGQQHLYNGSEVDCQNLARKFAGAFLDGAFAFHSRYTSPVATSEHHKPLFYTAFGSNGMALPSYAGHSEFVVIANVLAVAKNEGFKGTGKERMQELGWTVRPVFASPVATQGEQEQPEDAIDEPMTPVQIMHAERARRELWDSINGPLDWPGLHEQDATRYRYLRGRDVNAIDEGGVFAGMTPENVVLNGEDLDAAIDAALSATTPPVATTKEG